MRQFVQTIRFFQRAFGHAAHFLQSGYTSRVVGLIYPSGFEMSYAELISKLRALPVDRRVQLFDFTDLFEAHFGLVTGGLQPCAEWDDFSQDAAISCNRDGSKINWH